MQTYIKCKSNVAFEDQLTTGVTYAVYTYGSNGYLIKNDKGERKWYGRPAFEAQIYVTQY